MAIFVVPGGWIISTWISYVVLLKLTDVELENMEFAYKRNEQFGGCLLSNRLKSKKSEENEDETNKNKTCLSSFFDFHAQEFDLSGKWIDIHELFNSKLDIEDVRLFLDSPCHI